MDNCRYMENMGGTREMLWLRANVSMAEMLLMMEEWSGSSDSSLRVIRNPSSESAWN